MWDNCMHERMQSHAFPSARMHASMNAHVRTPYVMREEIQVLILYHNDTLMKGRTKLRMVGNG